MTQTWTEPESAPCVRMGTRSVEPFVAYVADDADDLAPGVGAVGDVDPFADGIFVREKLTGHRFVDDRDTRRLGVVLQ